MRTRRGFTLVELLVVIAIIGILIGMLLPAIQQVREAARRISCSNKVRNIALGLLNYESAHHKFPRGWMAKNGVADPGYGWMVPVLPFVEQNNLRRQINLLTPTVMLPVEGVRTESFDLMFCPSSTYSEPTHFLPGSGDAFPFEIGRTHYIGSIGSTLTLTPMGDGTGVF